jgi:hypothetical protein
MPRLDLAPHNMTADTAPWPYVASASGVYGDNAAYHAFDGKWASTADDWWFNTGTTGASWLQIQLPVPVEVGSYGIRGPGTTDRSPRDFALLGSNDGRLWDVLDRRGNVTGWAGQRSIRVFDVTTTPIAYRYFRLAISRNNGGTYTGVAELYRLGCLRRANRRRTCHRRNVTFYLPCYIFGDIHDRSANGSRCIRGATPLMGNCLSLMRR